MFLVPLAAGGLGYLANLWFYCNVAAPLIAAKAVEIENVLLEKQQRFDNVSWWIILILKILGLALCLCSTWMSRDMVRSCNKPVEIINLQQVC